MMFPFIKEMFHDIQSLLIIPILVGSFGSIDKRQKAARRLAEILPEDSIYIISSDFCHYGSRFGYSPQFNNDESEISKSIERMDIEGFNCLNNSIDPIECLSKYLNQTRNTICGRNSIILLLEIFKQSKIKGSWELIDYSQSNQIKSSKDCSVSYLAACFKSSK